MDYLSFKYREGEDGLQEVIERLRFQTKTGIFEIKLVRTPNVRRIKSTSPIVFEGEDYSHYVYAGFTKRCGYLWINPCRFPDSKEGIEEAKKKFNSLLLEFHKMKNQASPKRWNMFKKST